MPKTQDVLDMIVRYVDSEIWLALFFASVIYLLAIAKKRQKLAIIVMLASLCLFINDYVLHFVEVTMKESQRFYRYLWIIPFVYFIITAIVDAFRRWKHIIPRGLIILGCGVLGFMLYQNSWLGYLNKPDVALVPAGVAEMSEQLDRLRQEKELIVAVPNGLHDYLEMYNGRLYCTLDSAILNDDGGGSRNLSSENPDVQAIMSACSGKGIDYLIVRLDGNSREAYESAGYLPIYEAEGLGLYACAGYAGYRQNYNNWGQLSWRTWVDAEGNPVLNSSGYATVKYTYNDKGWKTGEAYFDTEENPCQISFGYAGIQYEYDNRGRNTLMTYVDPQGNPADTPDGQWTSVAYAYDKDNRKIQEVYLDAEGKLMTRPDVLYAGKNISYDSKNRVMGEAYFDSDGQLTISRSGYAEFRRERNAEGKITRESYWDTEGNPMLNLYGYAAVLSDYDEAGHVVRESYLDKNDHPVNCVNGYAQAQWEYDQEGRIALQRYLDAGGNPVITPEGYAETRRVYSGSNVILESYYGTDGAALTMPGGYSAIRQEWEEDDLISRTYLDADGNSIQREDGYAEAAWTRNEAGVWNIQLKDLSGADISLEGRNLARDIHYDAEGWSEWMIPTYNKNNVTFTIGTVNLGDKKKGDVYTCQIEIEFRNVTATKDQQLRFQTRGAQDGKWGVGSPWNNKLVNLKSAPEDGVNTFVSTVKITGEMEEISTFSIGFRCDYWASGAFRVRNVKIERGEQATSWTPGI